MSNNDCFIRTWGSPVLYMCMKQLYVIALFRFNVCCFVVSFQLILRNAGANSLSDRPRNLENGELFLIVVTGF